MHGSIAQKLLAFFTPSSIHPGNTFEPKSRIMKNSFYALAAVMLGVGLLPVHGQFGPRDGMGAMSGPQLSGSMAQLFGEHSAFSATLDIQVTDKASGDAATVPGKLAYAEGKSRFDMEISQIKGNRMSPEMAAQMKQMGMDSMVMITRPDKKVSYMIYSGLQAYVENPLQSADTGKPASDFKVETTDLGKETVDGRPCIKNKVVVTDKDGKKLEATVWNATDLKKFPVKIETVESGNNVVMLYKEVKFAKPAASQFDPPSGFTKYENMQTMMQQIMMKRFGEGQGLPPQR